MFGTKPLFGNYIEPACGYCRLGTPTNDGGKILCPNAGVLPPHYSCKKFRYDPLRRIPSRQPELSKFEKADFEL
ncbi:MAG: hypothetical protein RR022_05885 [Angelakisella sp.]